MKKRAMILGAILSLLLLTSCSSEEIKSGGNTGDNSLYLETFGTVGKFGSDVHGDFLEAVTDSTEKSVIGSEIGSNPTETEEKNSTLTYTNLLSKSVQESVKQILISAGIPKKRAEKVFEWVNDYNGCMGSCESFDLKDEFTSVSAPVVDYGDYYPMSTLWFKTNKRDYGDILCRLAAFELLSCSITVKNPIDKSRYECYSDNQWLYSDYDAVCNNPLVDMDEGETEKYFSLYSPIEIKKECGEQEMYDSILKEWEKRGVSFEDIDCSLITIWIQDGGLTAAGHAAVLAENGEELLLFEKTNPQSPYQATRFSDLEQVKRYMYESIHSEDLKYGSETGTYIVMQNEKML